MSQFNHQFITSIIDRYRLEPDDEHISSIVATWIGQYDRAWIVKAIVESLHRGRYKIKSVDSILSGWQRTGKPCYNFPPEFEREILQDLPIMSDLSDSDVDEYQAPLILSQLDDPVSVIQFPSLSSEQLNPEESAPFPHHDRAIPTLQCPAAEQGRSISQSEVNSSLIHTSASTVISQSEDDVKLNHGASHPKFQLFHTLRAIITPNQAQAIRADELVDPPSYSTDLA